MATDEMATGAYPASRTARAGSDMEGTPAAVSSVTLGGIAFTVECSATRYCQRFAPPGVLSVDCEMRVLFEIVGDEREERSTGAPRTLVVDITEVWVQVGTARIAKPDSDESWPADIWHRLVGEPRRRALTFIRDHHEAGAIDAVLDAADDPFAAVSLF